jgi:PPOX class probable F420-dependent enzyme
MSWWPGSSPWSPTGRRCPRRSGSGGTGRPFVYSQPDKPKLRRIAASPRVALALRTDELGTLLAVLTGEARVDERAPAAHELPGYATKYRDQIAAEGFDPAAFAAEYRVPIRITPTKLRAW